MTTILISGANRGIGLEFARQYSADGATIVAGVRDPDAATELKALKGVEIHALDVADDASVAAFRDKVGDRPIDILIANAGVGGREGFGDLNFAKWLHVMNVNTLGPMRLAQAFVGNLKRGEDRKLVAISSILGSTAQAGADMTAYRASKAALNNAWAGLADGLKGDGVVCLPLHPGWVKTDMGGPGAAITPQQSVQGLRRVIAEAGPNDTGVFQDYAGKPLPW